MSFYEKQSASLPESMRLFFYLQIRDTPAFLNLAKSTSVDVMTVKNDQRQSLMHMCAKMGNVQVAEFLVQLGCLGTERDVSTSLT